MRLQIYHYVPHGVDVQNLVKIDLAVAALRMREKTRFRVGVFLQRAAMLALQALY